MSRGLLGKKLGMTQIFEKGTVIPVTVIKAGPCTVVQKKEIDKDGYNAIQIGMEQVPIKKINKPLLGHFKKANLGDKFALRYLAEFKVDNIEDYSVGQTIDVSTFKVGELVDIQGRSIGKGFRGVISRHHCGRGAMTHGSKFHRHPGSIGAGTFPGRVFKGRKMAGRQGNKLVTIKNLKIVSIEPEQNLILVKGAVPGPENSLLKIKAKS